MNGTGILTGAHTWKEDEAVGQAGQLNEHILLKKQLSVLDQGDLDGEHVEHIVGLRGGG